MNIPSRNRSLSTQLILSLGILLSLFAVAEAIVSYDLARVGVNAVLDSRLSNVAERVRDVFEEAIPRYAIGSSKADDVVVLVWEPDVAQPARTTDRGVTFDRDSAPGFSDQTVKGEAWRVYTLVAPDNDVIQVAQRFTVRKRMASASAFRALLPIFVLIPAVWAAVFVCVRQSFSVLNRLGRRVSEVDCDNLVPLPANDLPVELLPFVRSINRMIKRLDESIKVERNFISDAAHELRTPLTALMLQADNLQSEIVTSNRERFMALRQTINRASLLVNQLLQLARVDARIPEAATRQIEVTAVVTSVVSELLPIATAKRIDIGAPELSEALVQVTETDLRAIVKNLVDNALRYTPEGGAVDLRVYVQKEMVVIEVRDTGPGIPESLLPRVFDRFFRADNSIEGSGLGLAIVRAIVSRYCGTIVLRNIDGQTRGLSATVSLPVLRGKSGSMREP